MTADRRTVAMMEAEGVVTWGDPRHRERFLALASTPEPAPVAPDAVRMQRDGQHLVVSLRYGGDSTLREQLRLNPLEPNFDHILAWEPAPVSDGLDDLTFASLDGVRTISLGQGDHCVLVQVRECSAGVVAVALTDDEAERMARSLLRRVAYSRAAASPSPETE